MPGQLSSAASYIADVLESAVCATVLKALPPVLAGFSQCVVNALATAATQQQQQGAGSPGTGQQQQLMMAAAAEELLKGLQAACQKAISAEAVAELMQSGSSIQALMAGREQQAGPQQQPGSAVAALAMAANAAGGMGQQELASAATAAGAVSVVKPECAAAAAAAATAAVKLAAGSMRGQQQRSAPEGGVDSCYGS
jgi:hypothetical protein